MIQRQVRKRTLTNTVPGISYEITKIIFVLRKIIIPQILFTKMLSTCDDEPRNSILYLRACAHMRVCMRVCVCMCVHVCACMCMRALSVSSQFWQQFSLDGLTLIPFLYLSLSLSHTHTHTHTRTNTHAHTHAHTHTHTHTHSHAMAKGRNEKNPPFGLFANIWPHLIISQWYLIA